MRGPLHPLAPELLNGVVQIFLRLLLLLYNMTSSNLMPFKSHLYGLAWPFPLDWRHLYLSGYLLFPRECIMDFPDSACEKLIPDISKPAPLVFLDSLQLRSSSYWGRKYLRGSVTFLSHAPYPNNQNTTASVLKIYPESDCWSLLPWSKLLSFLPDIIAIISIWFSCFHPCFFNNLFSTEQRKSFFQTCQSQAVILLKTAVALISP